MLFFSAAMKWILFPMWKQMVGILNTRLSLKNVCPRCNLFLLALLRSTTAVFFSQQEIITVYRHFDEDVPLALRCSEVEMCLVVHLLMVLLMISFEGFAWSSHSLRYPVHRTAITAFVVTTAASLVATSSSFGLYIGTLPARASPATHPLGQGIWNVRERALAARSRVVCEMMFPPDRHRPTIVCFLYPWSPSFVDFFPINVPCSKIHSTNFHLRYSMLMFFFKKFLSRHSTIFNSAVLPTVAQNWPDVSSISTRHGCDILTTVIDHMGPTTLCWMPLVLLSNTFKDNPFQSFHKPSISIWSAAPKGFRMPGMREILGL